MMNVFFTADQHWGHNNIIGFCNRPFESIANMDNELIERWNERIRQDDIVFVVGDFIWWTKKSYVNAILQSLNGNIILVKGSHDKATDGMVPTVPHILMRIGEFKCLVNHVPCYPSNHPSYRYGDSTIPQPLIKKVDFIISAHVHKVFLWNWKNYNIGVDWHDFYPLSLEQIEQALTDFREKKGKI